jgi:hypothetical protein
MSSKRRWTGWRGCSLVWVVPCTIFDASMSPFNHAILRHFALSVHHLAPLLLLACIEALEVDTARRPFELAQSNELLQSLAVEKYGKPGKP